MFTPLAPPPQYDHPYAGPAQEAVVSPESLRMICGPWQPYACSMTMPDGTGLIVIVRGLPPDLLAKFERHERAHLNGWRADHPGGTR